MLQFETLLVNQLQRQQSRAEFCDTVLKSQGVSIPVHSCVLSAFSPWLCGALSTMPAPLAGQRRLIELQRVEACTLLGLVSLLYSGQLDTNREDVLSAAEQLGIKLPEEHVEERRRRKDREDGKKERTREISTQTTCDKEKDEREIQTDHISPEHQHNIHLTCHPTNQEQGTYASSPQVTLQGAQRPPERTALSSNNVLGVVPETGGGQIVSEPLCVSQLYQYPSEISYQQPPSTRTPHTSASNNTPLDLGPFQSGEGVDLGNVDDHLVEGFEQFEGNIPGFINYFFDPVPSQTSRRRGRGRPRLRGRPRGERSMSKASSSNGTVREGVAEAGRGRPRGRGRGRGRGKHTERWGWAPRLTWRGQGGGTVGRKLDTRPTVRLTRRRRGRGALPEVGEGRGRGRQRGRRGAHAGSEGQDGPPCLSSQNGYPDLSLLPLPPCSSSVCQNTMDHPDPSILHTVSLPPAPQACSKPMDLLLNDIMTGLNLLPDSEASQHGFVNTTTPNDMLVSKPSFTKPAGISQHQPEGELCDILDRFLSTFEQQVGGCDLALEEEVADHHSAARNTDGFQVNGDCSRSSWSSTYTHLQPQLNTVNPHSGHCYAMNTFNPTTQPQPTRMASSSSNTSDVHSRLRVSTALSRLRSSWYRRSVGNLDGIEKEITPQRMTRSQATKRKLGQTSASHQNSPLKKMCREKKRTRRRDALTQGKMCNKRAQHQVDMCVYEGTAGNIEADKSKNTEIQSTKSTTQSLSNNRQSEMRTEENRLVLSNAHGDERHAETQLVPASSSTSQTPVKNTGRRQYIEMASSAFEKMRMLMENKRRREEERLKATNMEGSCKEKESAGNMDIQGHGFRVEEGKNTSHEKNRTEDTVGSIMDVQPKISEETEVQEGQNETGGVGCRQENEESTAAGLDQMITDNFSTPFQTSLSPVADLVEPTQEAEECDCNNNDQPMLSTAESPQSTFDSCWTNAVFSQEVLQSPLAKGITLRADWETGEVTPVTPSETFFSHPPLCRELLPSHTPEKAVRESAGSSEEDEDVDVTEVPSFAPEPIAVQTVIWEVGLSTEEDELEEDVDVLGVESD